jgi:hypothetical protein
VILSFEKEVIIAFVELTYTPSKLADNVSFLGGCGIEKNVGRECETSSN